CALLFAVTTINYMDRQVLSILAPTLQRELTWSESQYAAVVYSFTLVYAFGFPIAGRWLDRVGVRRGFATAVILWSVAAMSTAFVAVGALGLLWLLLWLALYRSPPADTHPDEPAGARVPWIRLLGVRQTWAIVVGKLMADPIWWFYLYWLPKFLDAKYGIKLAQVALPLIVVYLVADVGSIAGGWLSSGLMKRGWTANRARK